MALHLPWYDHTISLQRLDLITVDLPQKVIFTSGIGVRKSRRALIVRWTDQDGQIGYGECSCRPDPYYSEEFLEAAFPLVEHYLWPELVQAQSLREVHDRMRKVRGWYFTKAAMEFAVLDLLQSTTNTSFFAEWDLWPTVDQIPVGISIGIHETEQSLRSVIQSSKELGYRRLKFKISPRTKTQLFEAVRPELEGLYVSFDANGTFRSEDLKNLAFFAELGEMIEQPFPPGHIDLYQASKKQIPSIYICQDEEVKSLGDLQKIHQLGCIDELNLKPGRVGGIISTLNILQYTQEQGIPCWIGGMFETGIGRAMNSQIAGLTPDALAHDQSPSARYFKEDLVHQPLTMNAEGFIDLEQARRVTVDPDILDKYTVHVKTLQKD
ncbi:MAG: o-succinylbenzoate synthase [Bacteroidota bacterium]